MKPKRNPYWIAIRWLGGTAAIALILMLITPSLIARLPEDVQNTVLVHAIPFYCLVVAILMLYILLIVLLMIRFTGKVPYRIYSPIDTVITFGIIAGIVCLFQPFIFVAYRYGFMLLLVGLILFIVWSHVVPRAPKFDQNLPPVRRSATIVAALVALALFTVLSVSAYESNVPVEPYGIRQRLWNSYDDAQRQTIADQAEAEFTQQIIPFILIANLWPAALVFFLLRGAIDGYQLRKVKVAHGHTVFDEAGAEAPFTIT